MGQQQLILITLSTIIVGVAIAVGTLAFSTNSVTANRDAMVLDLQTIAANARAFYARPAFAGGGGNAFTKYRIPGRLRTTDNGTYSYALIDAQTISFSGISAEDPENKIVQVRMKSTSDQLYGWSFGGEFDDGGEE